MSYPVGKVAEIAGVTVRTLHHYDEIGLLTPCDRTNAGYRRYNLADLVRLQQILFYRELGFSLDQIVTILDDPESDAAAHYRRQRELLLARIKRLQEMVTAIEFAMEAMKVGIQLTPEERFEVLGDFDPDEYAGEAERKWGGTEAYVESVRRTNRYTRDDWQRWRTETADWSQRLTATIDAGLPADGPSAMALAEEHRQSIGRWFYECSYEIHAGLAEMYVTDGRFTAYYERLKPGLAQYLHDAILANAAAR